MNPFGRNWFESTKNMDLLEKAKNWFGTAKDGFGKSKSWVEGKVSNEQRDLLIKGGGALLLSPAICYSEGFGSAFRFILTSAASDDHCCKMAQDKLEKGKIWVEEEIRTKGSMSAENLDLLIKAGGTLLLAPVLGYYGGLASACGFMLRCAPSSGDCLEMAKNRSETAKSWAEMAKNGYETSKSWTEEKIRATGISDEHRNLVVKGGGVLLLATAMGYYGGLGGACRFIFRGGDGSGDREKLMKAPGRPGEFIARAAFEASPKAYFRGLRGKLP